MTKELAFNLILIIGIGAVVGLIFSSVVTGLAALWSAIWPWVPNFAVIGIIGGAVAGLLISLFVIRL